MSHHAEFQGEHARSYNKRPSFWRTKSLVDSKRLRLKPGQRLLDIGAGTGTDVEKLFARYGGDVELYGVEPSKDMLAQVAPDVSNSPNVHFKASSAVKLPFGDNFFDYVTCSLVLHHLSGSDRRKALQEAYRVLKPEGTVLIKEWGRPRNILGRCIVWFWRNHAYVSKSTSDDLESLLKKAGFRQVETLSVNRGIMYQLAGVK